MINTALKPHLISAISFDLDDTLYDNRPIIINAEQKLLAFLAKHYPLTTGWDFEDWLHLKKALIDHFPLLKHDTSAARLLTLEQGLLALGYDTECAAQGAQKGLDYFLTQRSDFVVAKSILEMLGTLGEHYRLIGITNGNVDAANIGLQDVFEFVLHPGNGTRMKPHPDMFYQAYHRLGIQSKQLLHVGDSFKADVQGARQAGCQVAWLNPAVGRQPQLAGSGMLPHIQLSALSDLLNLI